MTTATVYDLESGDVRGFNQRLHRLRESEAGTPWRVVNPKGAHAIACGLTLPVLVEVEGHAGYYCAGMNQRATVDIHGNCGVGVAENMMSGSVRVRGHASQSAGASAHGGLLTIEGDASARCGISMKGVDIVVRGSVGHMSAFMGQLGNLVVCGDAGEALGDSLYEASIFVRGKVASLGADCVEKEMTEGDRETLCALLERARVETNPNEFRRYGSARALYRFDVDHADQY
jgi:glutamate synthase domain-containing protein 3